MGSILNRVYGKCDSFNNKFKDECENNIENKSNNFCKILVIDDEPFNLEILADYLEQEHIESDCYADPQQAWQDLDSGKIDYLSYHCVLLDKMMARMDGLEFLQKIKNDQRFHNIPVIMQTADNSVESLCKGVRLGAFYYLTKPFNKDLLLTVVEAALADYQRYLTLQQQLAQSDKALLLMHQAKFEINDLAQADKLAALLANCCPNPHKVILGLSELLINAIEHGNLGISFDFKTQLLKQNNWSNYILNKLQQSPFSQMKVSVEYQRTANEIVFVITDQGHGFDWQQIEAMSMERVTHSHGRGVLIAKNISFDSLTYIGVGNQVKACVKYSK